MTESSRYAAPTVAVAAPGWTIRRITPPSRLFGANGLRTGHDGRIYVAQVSGSQISALDPDNGAIEVVSPLGGDIVAPDDIAFDNAGNLFATEITEGRVSMLAPNGTVRVIQGDIPVANPITWHEGRLIAGECRPGARILELNLDGGAPRVILDDVPMANAFEVGPDGKLYFPVMGANQIWRVDLGGGAPEVVAGDLGVPDAVKFDSRGRIVTTQVATGQVLRIDPQTGAREVLAQLDPGLDNLTFVGERLFVSSIPGDIVEIIEPGRTRPLIARGLQWPLGLAHSDGTLFVADGAFSYAIGADGTRTTATTLFDPGSPGYIRGVCKGNEGAWIVTTGLGAVVRYRSDTRSGEILATGYDRLMGVVAMPGGAIAVAEYGTGRVLLLDRNGDATPLATGLDRPMGLAVDDEGRLYVSESGRGRVLRLDNGAPARTVVDGLSQPQGIALREGAVLVVDVAAKTLTAWDVTGVGMIIASDLPVGAPHGIVPRVLGAVGTIAGPMIPFADVTVDARGDVFVSGDAEGSVLKLSPAAD